MHGGITDDSRNSVVDGAKKNDYDYVFFMDSDMVFQKGALAKLLRSQFDITQEYPEIDAPCTVGGLYNTRSDHRVNVYDWDERVQSFKVVPTAPMTGLYKCDFVATGCQLIDMGVFDQINYPYFEYWYRPAYKGGELKKWSEDAVFAKKCLDAGLPHFVDSDVVCKHIHTVLIGQVDKENFEIIKMNGQSIGMPDQVIRMEDVKQRKNGKANPTPKTKKKVSKS